jgi:chromosome segregation ATPase
VVNTVRADEQTRLVDEIETIRCQMSRRVSKLKGDKSILRHDLEELSEVKQQLDTVASATERDLAVAREHIAHLKENLQHKSKKSKSFQGQVRELSEGTVELKMKVEHRDQSIQEMTQTIAQLKEKIQKYKDIEARLVEMTTNDDNQTKSVAQLKLTIEQLQKLADANAKTAENELQGRRQAEAQMYQLSNQLSDLTIKLHDQESLDGDNGKQLQRLEKMLKKKAERLTATEEINRGLRKQVSELQERLQGCTKVVKSQKQEIEICKQKVIELESSNRDQTTLCQFIHKITTRSTTFGDSSDEN